VVGLPSIASLVAEIFGSVLAKPQLQHFTRYLTGLIVCTNRTVQGINDVFLGQANKKSFALTTSLRTHQAESRGDMWGYVKGKRLKAHTAASREELETRVLLCLLSI
jgi:hypothetical protein